MINKNYILNLETNKIELHFTKEEYQKMSEELKKELKSSYLFSNYNKCWVSRSTKDHYWAIKTAEKLGFTEKETKGERLSYAEQLERKAEKAENRIERYEQYSENATKRAENLQAERERYRGDISFWTQPIISGHSGSQRFAKYRQRVIDKYMRGFEEYKKSEYYQNKAATARDTANMSQLTSKRYLDNRIKECNKNLKQLQDNITNYESQIKRINQGEIIKNYKGEILTIERYEDAIITLLDKFEWEQDKLIFLQEKLEELGGINYSKENVKPGYMVKIRGYWDLVVKVNPTTVLIKSTTGMCLTYRYAEIQEMKIPENYQEVNKKITEIENPFVIGDIFCNWSISGSNLIRAYQVIKSTDKTITIKEIEKDNNLPIKDQFKDKKPTNKKVSKDINGNYRIVIDDWSIYKYTPKDQAV